MADLKTSKITRLKIGYTNNDSYLSESDSTALDILGDARITGNTNLYGNLNIIKNNINLFQLNQDGVTIPTLNTTNLNINGSSFTDIQNNINSSISSSSSTAETNSKKFASSEIAKLNKSHTDGKYISSISAPNGNGNSAVIAVNETSFDSYTSLTSLNGIQNKVITNYVDTKINNEKEARKNKDTSLENDINLMQNSDRDGTLANRIKKLETLKYKIITSGTDLTQSPWNSGRWLILGAGNIKLYHGNDNKVFYAPFIFSNATVTNTTRTHSDSYKTGSGSYTPGGSQGGYTVYYTDYYWDGSIKINDQTISLSHSTRRENTSSAYNNPSYINWDYPRPVLIFDYSASNSSTCIAIKLPDNIAFSLIS